MPTKKWNKEKVISVAAKCSTLKQFREENKGAYLWSLKNNCKDEVTKNLTRAIKPSGYWNFETCRVEAGKYQYKTEFMRNSGSAYNRALSSGWLEQICEHMVNTADGYHHCVYVIKNDRLKMAYIGITRQNLQARFKLHRSKKNTAKSKILIQEEDTLFVKLTDYVYETFEVKEKETYWCTHFEKDGYEVLNDRSQLGRTGVSNRKYSDEDIKTEALKYKRRVDFKKGSPKIYDAAVSQRILAAVCKHMRSIKNKNYWTKRACIDFANRCKHREEFCREKNGAYSAAVKNGWIEEIYKNLRSKQDMPWLNAKGNRVIVWLSLDLYYSIWVENGRCGRDKMKTITGFDLDKILKKFKSGWVPKEDKDWLVWAKENRKK